MSVQDDIFDVENALKHAHKMKPAEAREAIKSFQRVLARLNQAERAEDQYRRCIRVLCDVKSIWDQLP